MAINKKIKIIILFSIILLSFYTEAFASVLINEVEISPAGERFIELYNSGDSSVDLTDWYIQRKTATGADFGSLVSKTYFIGKNIGAHGFFVISRSQLNKSNIVNPSLTLTESNIIQLKNSSLEVVDNVGWGSVSGCKICTSNPPEGKSIQRDQSGIFFISSPTIGFINSSTDTTNQEDDSNINTSVVSTKEEVPVKSVANLIPYKVVTEIIKPKIITSSVPFYLYSNTKDTKGKVLNYGRYVWNFGNGDVKEFNSNNKFEYIYDHSGEYFVTLSFYDNKFSDTPDAVSSTILKVESSDIYISSIGKSDELYVELSNRNNYDADLSKWIISSGINKFLIPDGTTLLKDHKIRFSNKILKFDNFNSILLINPIGKILSTYPNINNSYAREVKETKKDVKEIIQNKNLEDSELLDLNKLKAQALLGSEKEYNLSYVAWFGFLILLILAIFSFVYFKKRKKDDLENTLNEKDITIIE
jgi:hypothetical protein